MKFRYYIGFLFFFCFRTWNLLEVTQIKGFFCFCFFFIKIERLYGSWVISSICIMAHARYKIKWVYVLFFLWRIKAKLYWCGYFTESQRSHATFLELSSSSDHISSWGSITIGDFCFFFLFHFRNHFQRRIFTSFIIYYTHFVAFTQTLHIFNWSTYQLFEIKITLISRVIRMICIMQILFVQLTHCTYMSCMDCELRMTNSESLLGNMWFLEFATMKMNKHYMCWDEQGNQRII